MDCFIPRIFGCNSKKRVNRIGKWADNRLKELKSNEAKNLLKQIKKDLDYLFSRWKLCGQRCDKCFFPCCRSRLHQDFHDCGELQHNCKDCCSYCVATGNKNPCKFKQEHPGKHHCTLSHECGETCSLNKYSGCNKFCTLESGHEGDHFCSTSKTDHLCGKKCDLDGCPGTCIVPYNVEHRCQCHRNKCSKKCELCSNECGSDNHFHAIDRPNEHHLCGQTHNCNHSCEHNGICEVIVNRVFVKTESIKTHDNKTLEYKQYSEQNGNKRRCYKEIPADKITHDGPHTCIEEEKEKEGKEYHSCGTKCGLCDYFCILPFGHDGLHDCKHGNMKNTKLEIEEGKGDYAVVKVKDKEYKISKGTSGKFLTCQMACIQRGRGHVHLKECSHSNRATCTAQIVDPENQRHQLIKYDENKQFDEFKCVYFWEKILKFKAGFNDKEKEEFNCCGATCSMDHEDAKEETDSSGDVNQNENEKKKNCCQLKLWHKPMDQSSSLPKGQTSGYISTDGHVFKCEHKMGRTGNYHTILLIDYSGSMDYDDLKPSIFGWILKNSFLNNRLGLVLEACSNYVIQRFNSNKNDLISFIGFNDSTKTFFERQKIEKEMIQRYVNLKPSGGTDFKNAIHSAFSVIRKTKDKHHTPVLIMFSDGECGYDVNDLKEKKKEFPELIVHMIGFNTNSQQLNLLKSMAEAANGDYHHTTDEVQLAGAFSSIANNPQIHFSVDEKSLIPDNSPQPIEDNEFVDSSDDEE